MANHFGYCNRCNKLAPASYEQRGPKVLLIKECPACGKTETVVSTDPAVWRAKRDLDGYQKDEGCALNCTTCKDRSHNPTTVFVDITNRCNQDCPICIANIPGMGFKFEPPFEYFTKMFDHLAAMTPKPSIKLFGGEPTVREDLFDLIRYARKLGLSTSIVTNGLRLADEEFCRKLVASRARIILAFDGRDPKVYEIMRGDASVYEKKLRAIENLSKHPKAKVTLMCVVAKGINDHLIADLIKFCHEHAAIIKACEFIPLTRTWPAGSIEADGHDITAMEDVEKIVAAAVPGGKLEFLPAGMSPFKAFSRYLPIPRLTFAGAHPNCESVSFLVSNHREFVPVTDFVKGKSLFRAVEEIVRRDETLGRRMARIESTFSGKSGISRFIGRALAVKSLGGAFLKFADTRAILGKHATWKALKIGLGLVLGRKAKKVLRANTELQTVLRVVVLPFEEPRTLDSARLIRCPAAFAYEDPDTRNVETMPVCTWGLYKKDVMRRIMVNYFPQNPPIVKG